MRAPTSASTRDERGVTLVELLVALLLNFVLITGIITLWQNVQKAYFEGAEAADVQQNVRVAMDRMVRTIELAGINPRNRRFKLAPAGAQNDPAFAAFRFAGRVCLRIYGDLDSDGLLTGTDENLSFTWDGTNGSSLIQESGGGPDVGLTENGLVYIAASGGNQELSQNVVANTGGTALFQYFTGPNDATPNTQLSPPAGLPCLSLSDADRSRIGRIVITLTGRGTVGTQTFTKTLASDVRPRNVP